MEKIIIGIAGIKEIIYGQYYDSRYGLSKKVTSLARKAGVILKHFSG